MAAKEPERHPKKFTDGIRPRTHRVTPLPSPLLPHNDGAPLPGSMPEGHHAPWDSNEPTVEEERTSFVEEHSAAPLRPAANAPPIIPLQKEKISQAHDVLTQKPVSFTKKNPEEVLENTLGNPLEDKRFSWLARPKFSDQAASQKHFASLGPKKRRRVGRLMKFILAALLLLAGGVALLSTTLARVTIAVKARVDDVVVPGVPVVFNIATHALLPDQRTIPAERIEITKKISGEFAATGRANVSERAHGRVTITNRYGSLPQPLVATTRFVTQEGTLYRLPKAVVVPGAKIEKGALVPQSIEVELVADGPGEGGNHTGAVALTIPGFRGTPKYDGFSASAPEGFFGGKSGAASVVTAADLKQAREALTKKAIEELGTEIPGKIPRGFIAPDALRELKVVEIAAPAAQSAADRFPVTLDARARILAVRPDDVAALVEAALVAGGDKRRAVVEGVSALTYDATAVDFEKGRAEVLLRGSAKMTRAVDTDALREMMLGKSQEEARAALLTREEISAFRISFFPPWRYTLPAARERVSVVLE